MLSGDAIYCACVGLFIMPVLLARSDKDIEGQDETPGRFETLGSPRSHAHAQSANRFKQDAGNMAAVRLPKRPADINVNVIYRLNRDEEGFNAWGRSKWTYTSGWDGCPSLPARFYDMLTAFRLNPTPAATMVVVHKESYKQVSWS